jgi:hypothetical protein
MTVACDDMNSIIQDDLDKGEAIYPGKAGELTAVPGMGRVWLYWQLGPDSRVEKTVISWTFNNETKTKEAPVPAGTGSRPDSTEITGLEEGLYTFSAYTVDGQGNKSITVESNPVNVLGSIYVASLSARGIAKTEMQTGGIFKITWQEPPANSLYTVLTYKDFSESETGVTRVDTIENPNARPGQIITQTSECSGLTRLETFSVQTFYQTGLDVAPATGYYYPTVFEKEILESNGLTELTSAKAGDIRKLAYPLGIETWTLQDLYYFPNLTELDLTPGTTDDIPTLEYVRSYTSAYGNVVTTYTKTVGGGSWPYFAGGYTADLNKNIIKDLLESGQLTKVKYTRNSYPGLDAVLEPYTDRVEWIPAALPEEGLMLTDNFLLDYVVENQDRTATVENSDDPTYVPAAIAAKRGDIKLRNVYRVGLSKTNSTVAFSLPLDVQFSLNPYGTLTADVYIQQDNNDSQDYEWIKGYSRYSAYKTVKVTAQTELSNFSGHSPYSNPGGNTVNATFPEDQLGTWQRLSWNLGGLSAGHVRVISLQLGADGAPAPTDLPSGKTLTYYFANLRFVK